jgi:hypothetical protein
VDLASLRNHRDRDNDRRLGSPLSLAIVRTVRSPSLPGQPSTIGCRSAPRSRRRSRKSGRRDGVPRGGPIPPRSLPSNVPSLHVTIRPGDAERGRGDPSAPRRTARASSAGRLPRWLQTRSHHFVWSSGIDPSRPGSSSGGSSSRPAREVTRFSASRPLRSLNSFA